MSDRETEEKEKEKEMKVFNLHCQYSIQYRNDHFYKCWVFL